MKSIKTLVGAAVMAVMTAIPTACSAQDPSPAPAEPEKKPAALDSEALTFAREMGIGWNLGNNLDAHWKNPETGVYESNETSWGNGKATQKTFDAVRKAGFKSVRIPVSWMGHIGNAPEYRIEKAWMDRVAEVVGYAHKAGLKVIVNIHHDGFGAETDASKKDNFWLNLPLAAKDEKVNTAIKQKLTMVWMQIANRFQNEDDWLIFETMNEIQDGKWGGGDNLTDGGAQYRVLNEWNQVCVDIIRATGGKNTTRYIGVPGYVCQPGLTIEHLVLPQDETPNRLMVAVHSYDPWDYAGSGKYSEWGHTGKDVVPDKAGEKEYIAMLEGLYNKYVKNGIPVYVGEFGCVHRSTTKAEDFRKYYLEYVCKAFREYGIPALFWDNGYVKTGDDAFGLINHNTGKYIANSEEICRIMTSAWANNDAAYTLQSIYDRAPQNAK